MLTKAIVTDIIDKYKIKLDIPLLKVNNTGGTDNPYAIVCSPPNVNTTFRPGDVVIVGFEDNNYSKPVIIGFLYKEISPNSTIDMKVNTVSIDADLTVGGESYPVIIKKLQNNVIDLFTELRELKNSVNDMKQQIEELKTHNVGG